MGRRPECWKDIGNLAVPDLTLRAGTRAELSSEPGQSADQIMLLL